MHEYRLLLPSPIHFRNPILKLVKMKHTPALRTRDSIPFCYDQAETAPLRCVASATSGAEFDVPGNAGREGIMTAVAHSHLPTEVEGDVLESRSVALDDPVPSDSVVAVIEPHFCADPPHKIESEVRRTLIAQPDLHFKVLVVRRVPNGVCLEGVLDADNGAPGVDQVARQVAGVQRVINRLMVRNPHKPVIGKR